MVYLTKHVKERMKERCKDWDVTMLVTMASMAIKCGMKFKKTVGMGTDVVRYSFLNHVVVARKLSKNNYLVLTII